MAIGDIGSVIENVDYGGSCYGIRLFHVTGDIYVMALRGGAIRTFLVDPAGDIGAIIDTYNCPGADSDVAMTHISGGVYARLR